MGSPVIPRPQVTRYTWLDVLNFAKGMARNVPLDKVGLVQCDLISAEMWDSYPWPDTCQNFAPGQFLISSGDQTLNVPDYVFRLVSAQIQMDTPQIQPYEPLRIPNLLPYSYLKKHPSDMSAIALVKSDGVMRFDAIPDFNASAETFELLGNYQLRHTRVASLNETVWWPDDFIYVAAEGALAWAYKLADRPVSALQQVKIFKGKLIEKWQQEYIGGSDQLAPLEGSIGSNCPTGWW
jgi:hypothetical protein